MKSKILWLFVISIIIAGMAVADADWEAAKAAIAREYIDHSKAIISTRNDTIAVQLDDANGKFNIGKVVGAVTLTYNYPSSPWSSWTCFYIDGVHYSNSTGQPTGSVPLAGGTVTYPFSLIPHSGDSSFIRGGWRQSDLDITQILQPVYVEHDYLDAYIFIKYQIVNTGTSTRRVGVILQLDTMIGSNDAAPLGTIWGYSGVEEAWTYDSMPPWWFAYEAGPPPPAGAVTAMGILDGFDAVRPNRFAVGGWGNFYNSGTWTYSPTGAGYWDSAVLYWWGVDTLAPGDTMVAATYYGIGHPYSYGSFTFVVDPVSVENCVFTPNPFSFFVMFTNESALALDSVVVHLVLPSGMSTVSGSTDTLMVGGTFLGTGGSAVMNWDIEIGTPPIGDTILVFVTNSSTSDTFWPSEPYVITLPDIGPPPAGFSVGPFDGAWTTCADQQISLEFFAYNGFDLPTDLTFIVDGTLFDLTSPRLLWEDDTLRYTPSANWPDGATVDWGLVDATDAMGCHLEDPVLGSFHVDLSPPVAENEWPPDGAVLGITSIPQIWVELYDVIRAVDPASIIFTCDGATYTVADPELTYANDTLRFDLERAGIVLADGDTICFEITSAADLMPDYCEPNVMEPYSWCFSINIVDIALPDTHLCPPGEIFDIPIYCEDLTGLGITELDITVEFFDAVLQPLGVELAGAVTSGWSLSETIMPNAIRVSGTGSELVGGGVLFYLKFMVPHGGAEGSFSPLNFRNAVFNDGMLATKSIDGFATVCFATHMWSNDLVFSISQQNRRILTFGVTSSASDGWDPGLDIRAIPVPSSQVDGYFHLDDPAYPLYSRLERDMRGPAPLPIVWTGHAASPIAGTVTCRWNSGHFPPGAIFMTYEDGGITRTINMKRVSEVTFDTETEFTIVYNQPELGRWEMITCPGWNLISFPFVAGEAATIREMVPHAITDGYWYDPAIFGYATALYPEPGKGYWVFCTAGDTFHIGGMLVDVAQMDIRTGWNLIGMPYVSTGTLPIGALITEPDVVVPSNIYGFDACGTGAYFTPTEFEVGGGYWLLSTANAFMTIEGDSEAPKALPMPEPEWTFAMRIGDMPYVIGIDDRAESGIDAFDRAIPPHDPDGGTMFGGVAEGLFLSRDIRPSKNAGFDIEADGQFLSWNPSDIPSGFELILHNGRSTLDMRTTNGATLSDNAKIVVHRVLPDRPELYSAVPNPFNPATEIKFAVPEAGRAELAVYDLMGRRVSLIVNGEIDAGVHSVIWDGMSDSGVEMPSGMYFYRLVFGDGKALTRSMVLLR